MKTLVDTNILIDQLRGFPKGVQFGKALPEDTSISAVTVTELYAGIRTPEQREKVKSLIGSYQILPFDAKIAEIAGDYMQRFLKSHGLNISDAVIAATTQIHNMRLCTLNVKHFPMFQGLKKAY